MLGRPSPGQRLAQALRGEPVAAADWTPVLALANEQLLTPALWLALSRSGNTASLDADQRAYVQSLHALNGRRNTIVRRQALELVGALNAAGFVPALLKGALTLFDDTYGDPAARMMRDIDLLVPASRRPEAIAVLEQLGYGLARGYGEEHHAFGDFARDGSPAAVDLHTEVVDPRHLFSAREVCERATLREVDGARFLAPSPTDRVLHNFLHGQIHYLGHYYRGEMPFAQLYELSVLARRFGPAIDWPFVAQRLAEHRLLPALHAYLLVAGHLFGLVWPLQEPACLQSRLHCLRCDLQATVPALQWLGSTWGNLRGPLAWHRMRALYGADGSTLLLRCRHVARFLKKTGARAGVARLRRAA